MCHESHRVRHLTKFRHLLLGALEKHHHGHNFSPQHIEIHQHGVCADVRWIYSALCVITWWTMHQATSNQAQLWNGCATNSALCAEYWMNWDCALFNVNKKKSLCVVSQFYIVSIKVTNLPGHMVVSQIEIKLSSGLNYWKSLSGKSPHELPNQCKVKFFFFVRRILCILFERSLQCQRFITVCFSGDFPV